MKVERQIDGMSFEIVLNLHRACQMIKTVLARTVYENDYVRIRDDEVEFPSGKRGTYYYQRWKAPHGVAVLPVTQDAALLVRNYRYGERSYSLEIPQGFGSDNETPLQTAQRELTEETGLKAGVLQRLFHTGHDFRVYVFVARLESFQGASISQAEESEDIAGFGIIKRDDISIETLAHAGIFDAITIAALFALPAVKQP